MPKSELAEEAQNETVKTAPVDILIGIAGVVDAAELELRIHEVAHALPVQSTNIVVAYPGTNSGASAGAAQKDGDAGDVSAGNGTLLPRMLPYALPAADPTNLPWEITSAAQQTLCALAVELEAKTCVLLHSDLALFRQDALQALISPVLENNCDLVLPVYPSRKFEGLLNYSVLVPLTRSLYGKRVRYPLAADIGCSSRMVARLAQEQGGANPLLWPATLAALDEYQLCQVNVDISHSTQTEGLELSTVLTSLVGAAFAEMEKYAAQWQRVRGSHPMTSWGTTAQQLSGGDPIDAKPMIDSFVLGSQNLQEVWGLVLPPVTLLELKKLARSSPEAFRMPDTLWARIIYDFALAHRLRKISRVHLLGALTPLYLGWIASYVQEVAKMSPVAAEQRLELLARAYEEAKPYLLSRWRWPDRFNP
jgi:glucosylglycerate synthase